MTAAQRQALFDNTARSLGAASREVQERHIRHCTLAEPAYGQGIAAALETVGRPERPARGHAEAVLAWAPVAEPVPP